MLKDKFLVAAMLVTLMALGASIYSTVKIITRQQQSVESPSVVRNEFSVDENVFMLITEKEAGTGYLINSPKYGMFIMTNKHICNSSSGDKISVIEKDNGIKYTSNIIRTGIKTDLCIVEIPTSFITTHTGLHLAEENRKLKYKESLRVYGHPYAKKLTQSNGFFINYESDYLTSEERSILNLVHIEFGKTNIIVFPGNSGSPVLDQYGLVVGTIFAYETDTNEGVFMTIKDMYSFLEGNI